MPKINKVEIRLIKSKKELNDILKIREAVFIKEQKVERHIERDGFDNLAKHIILLYKNKPIGCARVRFIDKKAKLERIAVLKDYRSMGFGGIITKFLVEFCKDRNVKEIMMNSQYYLKNFYRKFGFKPRGRPFMEAGIRHIEIYLD